MVEAIKKKETRLVEYDITNAAISEMKDKYKDLEIVDTKTYEIVRLAIADVRSKRTAVEAKRKDLKEDAIKWGKVVDGEAKRITTLLLDIEEPLKAEKQRVDDEKIKEKEEKERIERERVKGIQQQIEAIHIRVIDVIGKTSTEIQKMIDGIELENITEERFQEFTLEARKAVAETLGALHKAKNNRVKWEEQETIRKAETDHLEKVRKEQEVEAKRLEEANRKLEEEKAKIEKEKKAEEEAKERAERETREAKEREKREEAEKSRQKELKPDKEKIRSWAGSILAAPVPEVGNKEAQGLLGDYSCRLDSLMNELIQKAEQL